MKLRVLITIAAVFLVAVFAVGAVVASSDTPQPTITQLKAQLKAKTNRIADLKDERDAQDAVIADQNDTIAAQSDTIQRLRARDPLDAVVARGPDGLWAAANAIWQAFPTLPLGTYCGYAKDRSAPADVGLTAATITFYRYTGC